MASRGLGLAAAVLLLGAVPASEAASERPAPRLFGQFYAQAAASYVPRFLYDADHFAERWSLPADRSLFDLPTSRRTRFGRTVDAGTVTGTQEGGNAGVEFQRFRRPGRSVAVVDSFGRPFAYLRQAASDPEAITVLTQRREVFDRTFTGPVPGAPNGALVPATDPTKLFLQGFACMADRRRRTAFAIVGMQSGNATAPGNAAAPPDLGVGGRPIGVRGFVALRDLPPRMAGRSTRALSRAHDVGCAPRDLRVASGTGRIRRVGAHQPWSRFEDLYLGSRSWRACPPDASGRPDPESPGCGTPYGQYEAPAGLTPPGAEVALLTANTTGVTGIHAGVVRALYRSGPFRQVDEIAYADPNVPCGLGRRARWVFGDVNPRPRPGERHIWGWRPLRLTAPAVGDWQALTVAVDGWRCGAPPAAVEGRPRPAAPACPPAGQAVLAGDATARVYEEAGTKWVCEPETGALEELEDPVAGERSLDPPALDVASGRLLEVVRDDAPIDPSAHEVLVLIDVPAYVGRAAGSGLVLEQPLPHGAGSVRLYGSGAAYIDRARRVHVVTPGEPPRDRVVARGRDIDPRSLRVVAGRLRWSEAG